jgi:hypothetical protein
MFDIFSLTQVTKPESSESTILSQDSPYSLGVIQATLHITHAAITETLGTFKEPAQLQQYFKGREERLASGFKLN